MSTRLRHTPRFCHYIDSPRPSSRRAQTEPTMGRALGVTQEIVLCDLAPVPPLKPSFFRPASALLALACNTRTLLTTRLHTVTNPARRWGLNPSAHRILRQVHLLCALLRLVGRIHPLPSRFHFPNPLAWDTFYAGQRRGGTSDRRPTCGSASRAGGGSQYTPEDSGGGAVMKWRVGGHPLRSYFVVRKCSSYGFTVDPLKIFFSRRAFVEDGGYDEPGETLAQAPWL
ncbi:hypothetical protein B0H11DRAFT_2070412 [Mycena galericulata]|nr:hypothetical protein B0H11DRAFT_2070412 [Mycena galericulata]